MKISSSFFCTFLFIIFFAITADAQPYLSLSTGISKDVNNTQKSFYHIPVLLQWKPAKNKRLPIFFELDYGIPFTYKSTGKAYTLNPALPGEENLQENIRSYIFTAGIGFSIHLYTNKKSNSYYLNLLTGICNQNFRVDYKNYDKANYEVLNPDVNLDKGGLILAMEAAYNFHKVNQDMLLMLHVQSPLLQSTGDYPLSFKYMAPLQLTYGYKLSYNNSK